MKKLIQQCLPVLAALALGAGVSSCGGAPAPDGFTLAIQMQNVRVAAIDELRITMTPRMEVVAPMFEDIPPTPHDGGIVVDVEAGVLIITIPGDYVRANATGADGVNPRLPLEVWSDDAAMRMGPQVRATVTRGAEQIATGTAFLPSWPLVLGAETQVNVPCRMGFDAQCVP